MDFTNTRIAKVREYLINIIRELTNANKFQINANFLGINNQNGIQENYSLNKIATENEIETWITGLEIHKDVYSFRSRKAYSQDTINNLTNIGFFEQFENIINSNNEEGVLPDIDGIESIECLNCGSLNIVDGSEAIFDIQIQITYRNSDKGGVVSL